MRAPRRQENEQPVAVIGRPTETADIAAAAKLSASAAENLFVEVMPRNPFRHELEPLPENPLACLIRLLRDELSAGGLPVTVLEALLEQAEQPLDTSTLTASILMKDPGLRALTKALLVEFLRGGCMSTVLERYRQLLPDDLRYAVFVGEQSGRRVDALDWYLDGLFSSVPAELRRFDLLDFYWNVGASARIIAGIDLFLAESPQSRAIVLQIEQLATESGEPFNGLFARWRRGQLGLGPLA